MVTNPTPNFERSVLEWRFIRREFILFIVINRGGQNPSSLIKRRTVMLAEKIDKTKP
jgi:hypothetical protein